MWLHCSRTFQWNWMKCDSGWNLLWNFFRYFLRYPLLFDFLTNELKSVLDTMYPSNVSTTEKIVLLNEETKEVQFQCPFRCSLPSYFQRTCAQLQPINSQFILHTHSTRGSLVPKFCSFPKSMWLFGMQDYCLARRCRPPLLQADGKCIQSQFVWAWVMFLLKYIIPSLCPVGSE